MSLRKEEGFLSFLQPGASQLEAALVYASLRIAVFPLQELAKEPATKHGWHDATTNADRIKEWWSKNPISNIGIALRPSYIVVIDVDPRNGGTKTLADLTDRYGKLPHTYTVKTANGGEHYYYRVPADFYDEDEYWPTKLGDGVELLINKYVVAPPSKLTDNRYYVPESGVLNKEFQTAPFEWLRAIRGAQDLHKYDPLWTPGDEDWFIERGSRDNVLTSIAGWARAKGSNQREIELILHAYLPRFEDPEEMIPAIPRIARSVMRYKPERVKFNDLKLVIKGPRREPELDPTALYGPIGKWVKRIEPITEAHPAALMAQGIAAFGSIIAARKPGDLAPGFKVESSWHRTALYVNVIGDSAKAAKGDSWARVKELFNAVDPTWRTVSGVQTGEGLIDLLADDQPDGSPVTVQGKRLQPTRKGSRRDRRCMVIEPEFGRTLHVSARQGSVLKDVYRDLWDHGQTEKITAGSKQSMSDTCVSLVSHITKVELDRDANDVDLLSGFLNRFLHIYTKRTKNLPSAPSLPNKECVKLARPLQEALDFAQNDAPTDYDFSDSAWELWVELSKEYSQTNPSPLVDSLTARARPIVRRIAVILAVADCEDMIHYEHLEAAAALWDYCFDTIEFIFSSRLGNKDADKLFRALAEHRAGLTVSDVSRLFKGRRSADQIRNTYAYLAQRGLIDKRREKRSDRSSEVWFLPPDIL